MTLPRQVIDEITKEISKLEREDWHSDDRSRRAMITGLNIALRIVEGHRLGPDGPHSDTSITAAAEVFAESVRVLSYATRPAMGGVTQPQTVYAVLGSLATGLYRLDQVLVQLGDFMEHEAAHGRLGNDLGADPQADAVGIRRHLGAATRHAAGAATQLGDAHSIASHLYTSPESPGATGAEGQPS
ncbi:MAG TPA: hypothetical protein VFU43_29400 [Streptosporangiaceae bacterium]|nr:hypothetical protein [Streptosporangiaceae bacterium]